MECWVYAGTTWRLKQKEHTKKVNVNNERVKDAKMHESKDVESQREKKVGGTVCLL